MEEWNAMTPQEQGNELALCVFKLGFSETITEDEQTILAVNIHKRTMNEYRKQAEQLVKDQVTEKRLATRAYNEIKKDQAWPNKSITMAKKTPAKELLELEAMGKNKPPKKPSKP